MNTKKTDAKKFNIEFIDVLTLTEFDNSSETENSTNHKFLDP